MPYGLVSGLPTKDRNRFYTVQVRFIYEGEQIWLDIECIFRTLLPVQNGSDIVEGRQLINFQNWLRQLVWNGLKCLKEKTVDEFSKLVATGLKWFDIFEEGKQIKILKTGLRLLQNWL